MFSQMLILASIILFLSLVQTQCGSKTKRKEIRDMTESELNSFISAIKQLQSKPSNDVPSFYDELVNVHIQNASTSHG